MRGNRNNEKPAVGDPPVGALLRSLVGALGGISATGPMTIGMVWLHRLLPSRYRYALPPREITLQVVKTLGLEEKLGPEARAGLTLVNHFGYGAMAAIFYSLAESRIPGSPLIKGPLFGAIVWLVSYLGLLPAVGILHSAKKHPRPRNVLMFVVHLIWGLFVGVFVDTLLSEKKHYFGALLTPSPVPHKDRR